MACAECQRLGGSGNWHGSNVHRHGGVDDTPAPAEALKLNASRLYDAQLHVLLSKNADYSPMNISDAGFPDVMSGLITRLGDKYFRIRNLAAKGGEPKFESLEDSFADLMNYAAISLLCLRGEWPGVKKGGRR